MFLIHSSSSTITTPPSLFPVSFLPPSPLKQRFSPPPSSIFFFYSQLSSPPASPFSITTFTTTLPPPPGPGVSVVMDESFSIGEAAAAREGEEVVERPLRPSLAALHRQNDELLARLRDFGNFSFLLQKPPYPVHESSESSPSSISPP